MELGGIRHQKAVLGVLADGPLEEGLIHRGGEGVKGVIDAGGAHKGDVGPEPAHHLHGQGPHGAAGAVLDMAPQQDDLPPVAGKKEGGL